VGETVQVGPSASDNDRLTEAKQALEKGDYARVREISSGLANCSDAEITTSARELRRRTSVDPAHAGILVLSLVIFLAIAYFYLFRP
jgi:hypothetical protein